MGSDNKLKNMINTVTVVGANGTMGLNVSAIFAAFGNAAVYLVSREAEKSVRAREKACLSVRADSIKGRLIPVDYSSLEECVDRSDLIFEACAEDHTVKKAVHEKIAACLQGKTGRKYVCTGTSGLSVTVLAELYPKECRSRFYGMHFFNPPYQMTLCEMTPTIYSEGDPSAFSELKEYAQKILYRTVVQTKDTPAFLGNRIGFQFINEALQNAERLKYNGGIDYIDTVLGAFTGRSMPPLATANFVGLDVHKAIVDNLFANTDDYAHSTFALPDFVNKLVAEGKNGKKVGEGFYKTILLDNGKKTHWVFDIEHETYREKIAYSFPFAEIMIDALRVGDYRTAISTLVENRSSEAMLCCKALLNYIVYSLFAASEMGCDASAADDVMAAGFRWCPPLSLYEAFSEITDFEKLCEQRLSEDVRETVLKYRLFEMLHPSKYDFRRFLLAKH